MARKGEDFGSVLTIATFGWAGKVPCMARKLRVEYEGAIYHVNWAL